MAVSRYLTHTLVLVFVLALSGYASLDRHLPSGLSLRLGAVNAQGRVSGQGGTVNSLEIGRSGTIVKPAGVPTTTLAPHLPIRYAVRAGDTLAALADRFKVSAPSIRWSNFNLLQNTASDVSPGQSLLIPPVDGVALLTSAGDTAAALAARYHVEPSVVVDFNYLRTAAAQALPPDTAIVIPGGRGPDFEHPAAVASRASFRAASTPEVLGWTPQTGNRFAFGYCTWYVYNRRPVPWLGNAWEWFGNAQRAGWRTGQTPAVGAIMVTWESGWGHVAYVESVSADGSFTVSEMNYRAWDVVDYRTIRPGGVPLIGFIYGP